MKDLKVWHWIAIVVVLGIIVRGVFALIYGKELLAAAQADKEKEAARQAEVWAKMRASY